jgi:hypothetical protein
MPARHERYSPGGGATVWRSRSSKLIFEPAAKYSVEAAIILAAGAIEPESSVAHTGQQEPLVD